MTKQFHLCISVRGCLNNRDFGWFTRDDGSKPSPQECVTYLEGLLSQGIQKIPVGDECTDFDPQTGCRRHFSRVELMIERLAGREIPILEEAA